MVLFVSYASSDETAVRDLVSHLEAARMSVWVDHELKGGDSWWAEILHQIRSCSVFICAVSERSLRSEPCRREWWYAGALNKPMLPVQIADVHSHSVTESFRQPIVDYRNPTPASAGALVMALRELSQQRTGSPNPMPMPPPVPYEYLLRLAADIDRPDLIPPTDQVRILGDLRKALRDETEQSVHHDLQQLLRKLRERPEVTNAIFTEIGQILPAQAAVAGPQTAHDVAAGWFPDPAGNPAMLRYWDGTHWTHHLAPCGRSNLEPDAPGNWQAKAGHALKKLADVPAVERVTRRRPPH